MSQVVDTVFTGSELDRALVAPHEDVDADVWKAIIANQNYLWSRKGARMPGMIFSPAPFLGTVSTSIYSQLVSGGTSDYQLTNWYGVCTPQRREVGPTGTATYGFSLVFYGKNIEIQVTPTRFNDGSKTTLSTWTAATSGADFQWVVGSTSFAEATCHMGASTANDLATLGFSIASRRETSQGNKSSELLTFAIVERIALAAQLPDD